jgi:hypothetical protein
MQAFAKRNDGMKFDNQAYWQHRSHAGFENTLFVLRTAAAWRLDALSGRPGTPKDELIKKARSCLDAARRRPFHRTLPG